MTTAPARMLRLGTRSYPVLLPSLRDPRLHLAAVIISIHVLGQTALGFRVSVPHILVAILTCAVIEVAWDFARTRRIVWPASAMLTGSGVALILRIVGVDRGEHWTWQGWHLYALIAGFSLLSKYLIRRRGTHVFNPSNSGLVVAFLVLGSSVVEPLDFWWAPLDAWMATAYLIILVGGLIITTRLGLLPLAVTYWLALAVGLAVLSASGHCMTAAWSVQPVCGFDFWRVVVTSPEVLIFLFFMITDPKTIPTGRLARVGFAASLGVACALLMAPFATEFGAKVGLLGGLVLLTPLRSLFDRALPEGAGDALRRRLSGRALPLFARGAVVGSALVLLGGVIVMAGTPARGQPPSGSTAVSLAIEVEVDSSILPEVTVSEEARSLNGAAAADPAALAMALARDLAIEAEAMRRADTSLLRAADDGERLVEMEQRIQAAVTAGSLLVSDYRFDRLHLDVVFLDGPQGGASLALEAAGTIEQVTYDEAGTELGRSEQAFESTFVLTPGASGQWLIGRETGAGPEPE